MDLLLGRTPQSCYEPTKGSHRPNHPVSPAVLIATAAPESPKQLYIKGSHHRCRAAKLPRWASNTGATAEEVRAHGGKGHGSVYARGGGVGEDQEGVCVCGQCVVWHAWKWNSGSARQMTGPRSIGIMYRATKCGRGVFSEPCLKSRKFKDVNNLLDWNVESLSNFDHNAKVPSLYNSASQIPASLPRLEESTNSHRPMIRTCESFRQIISHFTMQLPDRCLL